MSLLIFALLVISPPLNIYLSTEITSAPTPIEQYWIETILQDFAKSVSIYKPADDYRAWAINESGKMMYSTNSVNCCELFVFVDRNPNTQLIMLGCYVGNSQVIELGWDKTSTGDPRHGKDYHYTPCGVFANQIDNFSYRAAGTRNSRGWRGYGEKGMRVWDFGWQMTTKPVRGKNEPREIRLLMHATDPDFGEPKLGTVQSKGCVRISKAFNKLVEKYGVIDRLYINELPKPKIVAILPKDRIVNGIEGRFLLVADSAESGLAK